MDGKGIPVGSISAGAKAATTRRFWFALWSMLLPRWEVCPKRRASTCTEPTDRCSRARDCNVGAYVSAIAGLPETVTSPGKLLSWAMVFVAITVALDVLYFLAPDAKLPFKWITPGGFIATVLLFVSDGALSYYVANLGNYGQIYGQLGAVIVFMLWLYVTGLMVLLGLEINAVLARMAEERKGIELVQTE